MDAVKKYVAPAVAIILFILVTAFFFKPLVFDGKRVKQGDIEHHEGMSKEIVDFRAKYHREPLWQNNMFGGMPAYQTSVLYPSNLLNPLQKGIAVITRIPFPVTAILMCMIGFYFLMLVFKVDPWLAIGGAIAFGLTSYMITLVPAGHNSKMYAISYMAPVLIGVFLAYRGRVWLGGALTALALALEINSNHLQITYYLLMMLVFIGFGENIRLFIANKYKEMLKSNAVLAIAVVLAILPNMSNLLLTSEYGRYTTRGPSELTIDKDQHNKTEGLSIDYATQWCYSITETYTLMIPDVMGGASQAIKDYDADALKKVDEQWRESIGYQGAYFGDVSFTSGPYYVGAIIFFLAILAFFIVEDKIKWWLAGISGLAIMLSWGDHFLGLTEFFFNYVPGYNKFRAVSMILVIVNLTFPLLAMLAVRDIMNNPGLMKKKINQLYIAFGLTAGICLIFWLMPGAILETVNQTTESQIISGITGQGGNMDNAYAYIAQLEIAREAIVSSDAGRSFALILIVAGLIWSYVRWNLPNALLIAGVVVLVSADMIIVGQRYISKDNYEKSKKHEIPYKASAADNMILQDKSDPSFRVLNIAVNTWQDASTAYFHKSIGGYHGAKLKRIQELYEQVLEKQIDNVQTSMQGAMETSNPDSVIQATLASQGAINMFNIKYIIYNPQGGVIINQSANGPGWFVDRVKIVPNADSEIVAVGKVDTRHIAVVDARYEGMLKGFVPTVDSNATVKLLSHGADKIAYETNSSVEGVVIFPEIYYPLGWNVSIDGQPAEYFCADYTLRGMKVPAGKHTITWEFHPDSYYSGEKIALIGSFLVFLFVIGGIAMDVVTRRKQNQQQAA